MPDLGIGEILAIASLVASGVGTGVSVYESNQQADASKALLQQQQQQQAQQNLLEKNKAIAAALPNAQSQTGGSLTGQAGQSFADILAGYAGTTGSGASGASSGAAPSSPSSSPNALQALVSRLSGGSGNDFSGGFNSPPPPQQGQFNLSQLNLG